MPFSPGISAQVESSSWFSIRILIQDSKIGYPVRIFNHRFLLWGLPEAHLLALLLDYHDEAVET